MKGFSAGHAMVTAALLTGAGGAVAVPPPPPYQDVPLSLPANQCRLRIDGTVRAYSQPVYGFSVEGPTVLRVLAPGADPALLIDLEHNDSGSDVRPVVAGAGLAGGDIRIAIPAAGRYRLRVLMTGDAARNARSIPYAISLSRAMDSGAAPCPDAPGG